MITGSRGPLIIASNKWHHRMLMLAAHISEWSKDPSTQVGAVICTPDFRIVSLGYNGFPRGVPDKPEWLYDRAEKYPRIVHGEMNAILFAKSSLSGYYLYTWPLLPCARCAAMIIQTGISVVIAPKAPEELIQRWGDEMEITKGLFHEARVAWAEMVWDDRDMRYT